MRAYLKPRHRSSQKISKITLGSCSFFCPNPLAHVVTLLLHEKPCRSRCLRSGALPATTFREEQNNSKNHQKIQFKRMTLYFLAHQTKITISSSLCPLTSTPEALAPKLSMPSPQRTSTYDVPSFLPPAPPTTITKPCRRLSATK